MKQLLPLLPPLLPVLVWGLAFLFVLWLVLPPREQLRPLLLNSVVESGRFSPRLLTTFAVVSVTLYLELKAAHAKPEVVNGLQISPWPPEYVLLANLTLIGALLGLGKLADTYKTVQLNKPAATTTIESEQTEVKGENVTVTPAGKAASE